MKKVNENSLALQENSPAPRSFFGGQTAPSPTHCERSAQIICIGGLDPFVVKPQLHVPEPTLLVTIGHTKHPELGLVGTVQQTIWSGLPYSIIVLESLLPPEMLPWIPSKLTRHSKSACVLLTPNIPLRNILCTCSTCCHPFAPFQPVHTSQAWLSIGRTDESSHWHITSGFVPCSSFCTCSLLFLPYILQTRQKDRRIKKIYYDKLKKIGKEKSMIKIRQINKNE